MIVTANKSWLLTINGVLDNGQAVSPQKSTGAGNRVSFELLAHTMMFNMSYPIVTIKPNTSWIYMVTEPLWVIEGSNQLNWSPEIEKIQGPYSDDQEKLNGAYGPPFAQQIDYVVKKLNEDPTSRQAVMTIWKRNPYPSKDIPCTVALQFIVRNGFIHCIVTMRSSDVGMGLPYDMFTFTCMAAEVASRLENPVELGYCFITAGSRHIYVDQFEALAKVSKLSVYSDKEYKPWAVWAWPGIKAKMTNLAFSINQYEDRASYQQVCKEGLLGVMP